MYAYARAHKIFAKAGEGKRVRAVNFAPQEKELLKKIMLFDSVIYGASQQLRPHTVAEYCLDLATVYNKFYNCCPVISCEDEKLRNVRLAINFAALCTLKNSLGAIGIEALEHM